MNEVYAEGECVAEQTAKQGEGTGNSTGESVPAHHASVVPAIRTSQIMWGVFWGMTLWSVVAGFVLYVIVDVTLGWSWLYYLLKGRW